MLRNEKGFTLIEIIAVLVILGILAAVAIPKYFDLMTQSRMNSAQSAVAEIQARASNIYAKNLLTNVATNDCSAVKTAVDTSLTNSPLGDFTVTIGACANAAIGGSGFPITVNTVKTVSVSGVTGSWYMPQ